MSLDASSPSEPDPDGDDDLDALRRRSEAGLRLEYQSNVKNNRVRVLIDSDGLWHGYVYVPKWRGGWRVQRRAVGVTVGKILAWLADTGRRLGRGR
jgi:hypothetical protein